MIRLWFQANKFHRRETLFGIAMIAVSFGMLISAVVLDLQS